MRRLFQDSAHLIRVAGLFGALLVGFLIVRGFLVPPGFGVYGHFRTGALDDNQAHPIVYAGAQACQECHSDEAATHSAGKHAGVHCEACHGPLGRHAEDPAAQEGFKPDPTTLCVRCHLTNVAKPVSFPQVDPADHAPDGACTDCHTPHDPGLE